MLKLDKLLVNQSRSLFLAIAESHPTSKAPKPSGVGSDDKLSGNGGLQVAIATPL